MSRKNVTDVSGRCPPKTTTESSYVRFGQNSGRLEMDSKQCAERPLPARESPLTNVNFSTRLGVCFAPADSTDRRNTFGFIQTTSAQETPVGFGGLIRSSGLALRTPLELSFVDPHSVEDDGEFSGDGDDGTTMAALFSELYSPGLER